MNDNGFSYGWQWAYHMLKGKAASIAELDDKLEGSLFVLGEGFHKGALAGIEDWEEEQKVLKAILDDDEAGEGNACD